MGIGGGIGNGNSFQRVTRIHATCTSMTHVLWPILLIAFLPHFGAALNIKCQRSKCGLCPARDVAQFSFI